VSFVLGSEDVDRLRKVADRLLRQSSEYAAIVREMGGTPEPTRGPTGRYVGVRARGPIESPLAAGKSAPTLADAPHLPPESAYAPLKARGSSPR
jgi:hypothetical protein